VATAFVGTRRAAASSPLVSGKTVADTSRIVAVTPRGALCVLSEGRHLGINFIIGFCEVVSVVALLVQDPPAF